MSNLPNDGNNSNESGTKKGRLFHLDACVQQKRTGSYGEYREVFALWILDKHEALERKQMYLAAKKADDLPIAQAAYKVAPESQAVQQFAITCVELAFLEADLHLFGYGKKEVAGPYEYIDMSAPQMVLLWERFLKENPNAVQNPNSVERTVANIKVRDEEASTTVRYTERYDGEGGQS